MSLLRLSIQRLLESETQASREHPTLKELLALHAGETHPSLENSIREHLVLCSECRSAFLDFDRWVSSASDAEDSWQIEAAEAWRRLRGLLPQPKRSVPKFGRPGYALAAVLLVATIGLGIQVARQQTELRQPILNPVIVEIVPERSFRGENQILVPETSESGSKSILLVVHPPVTLMNQEHLLLTLYSDQGRVIFQSSGVRADRLRPVSLVVPRSLLPPGAYSLELQASDTSSAELRTSDTLAKYRFSIGSQR